METIPDQCCRGCLIDMTSNEKYSFQCSGIKELFEKCTNLDVSSCPEESHLPHSICSACYSQCQQWLTFRDKCQENDRFIHSNAFKRRTTSCQDANKEESVKGQETPGSVAALPPVQIKQEPESEFEDGTFIDSKIDIVESDPVDFRELQVLNLTPNGLCDQSLTQDKILKAHISYEHVKSNEKISSCEAMLTETLTEVRNLKKMINSLMSSSAAANRPQAPLSFPLTLAGVARLEKALYKGDQEMANNFKGALIERKDNKDFKTVFSQAVLLKYNWTGSGDGKLAMKDSRVFQAVNGAWYGGDMKQFKMMCQEASRKAGQKKQKQNRRKDKAVLRVENAEAMDVAGQAAGVVEVAADIQGDEDVLIDEEWFV